MRTVMTPNPSSPNHLDIIQYREGYAVWRTPAQIKEDLNITDGATGPQGPAGPAGDSATGYIGQFLAKAAVQPVRVALTATSIGSFNISAIQVLAKHLQTIYGKSGDVTFLGAYGGVYTASGSYKKQNYGGASFHRLANEPGNADITYYGYVDKFLLAYSKETTGGDFDVYIDGVFDATLSSNGTQSYNNEYVKTFSSTGYHSLTIKAPTSGYAYLERFERLLNKPGVIIENATMGGYAASDFVNAHTRTPGTGNIAAITISGNNGTDSFFGRTGVSKPDVIIFQQFTNDSTTSLFQTVLDRAVLKTKETNVPLVLVTEQPSTQFISSEGVLNAQKTEIYNLIKSAAAQKHVSLVDWIALVDYSDKAAYTAKYYAEGETTHPLAIAHQVPMGQLLNLFNISSPGHQNIYYSDSDREKEATGRSLAVASYDKAKTRTIASISGKNGVAEARIAVGKAVDAVSLEKRNLYYSAKARNQIVSGDTNDSIAASPTATDDYGPYKTNVSSVFFVAPSYASLGVEETAIFTVLAKKSGSGSVAYFKVASN
jgi:hypothetical protein